MSTLLSQARRLGLRSRASARPNPWVGAVLSHQGEVVATGRTERPGGAHAEVQALQRAGAHARGATMTVTLEPCAHHGRTPPCVDAIVAAGVRRVEIGLVDPDPRVAGRGIEALRAAGVEVRLAPRSEAAPIVEELAPYLSHRLRNRPLVVAKVAQSLDARVADRSGRSQWITGPAARDIGHRLRAQVDAVLVGRGTFLADAPRLTARPGGRLASRQPARVVASRSPIELPEGFERWAGSPREFLEEAWRRSWLSVLLEGGPTLLGAYLEEGLVDEVLVGIAPLVLGDPAARAAWRLENPRLLDGALRGEVRWVRRAGDDLLLRLALPALGQLAEQYWAFDAQVLGPAGRG